jgi:tRNA-guanine family transglycosylase
VSDFLFRETGGFRKMSGGRMSDFHVVLGNRDYLKVKGEKVCISEFIDPKPTHWLTSLVYRRRDGKPIPEGAYIWDCGAWSYKNAEYPTWNPVECADFYRAHARQGDTVVAPDHMVLRSHDATEESRRLAISAEYAYAFLRCCPRHLDAMAVQHGKSIEERTEATRTLLDMGYRHIAIGSVAVQASNRKFVVPLLEETVKLKQEYGDFRIHVLGISALSWLPTYLELGIDSYDGSAMFFAAFTGAQFYKIDPSKPSGIGKYSVKENNSEDIPECSCKACSAMREEGIDTREMGSNENNMGRAVHNINVYLQAREAMLAKYRTEIPVQSQGRLEI